MIYNCSFAANSMFNRLSIYYRSRKEAEQINKNWERKFIILRNRYSLIYTNSIYKKVTIF